MSAALLRQQWDEKRDDNREIALEHLKANCSLLRKKRKIFKSEEEEKKEEEDKRRRQEDYKIEEIFRCVEARKDKLIKHARFSKLYGKFGNELKCYTGASMVSWYKMDYGALVDIVLNNWANQRIGLDEYTTFMHVLDLFSEH